MTVSATRLLPGLPAPCQTASLTPLSAMDGFVRGSTPSSLSRLRLGDGQLHGGTTKDIHVTIKGAWQGHQLKAKHIFKWARTSTELLPGSRSAPAFSSAADIPHRPGLPLGHGRPASPRPPARPRTPRPGLQYEGPRIHPGHPDLSQPAPNRLNQLPTLSSQMEVRLVMPAAVQIKWPPTLTGHDLQP